MRCGCLRPIRSRFDHRPYLTPMLVAVVGGWLAAISGCAGVDNPLDELIIWTPWEHDDPADLAKYGPTNRQRRQRIEDIAEAAGCGDAEMQRRVAVEFADQLRAEDDPLVRASLVRGLGMLPVAEAERPLAAALKDNTVDVRIAACQAWGGREGETAITYLSAALAGDESPDVRVAAARALGRRRRPDQVALAQQALAAGLSQDDPAVRYRVAEALESLTGESYGRDPDLWKRRLDGERLSQRGRPWGDMVDDWY